MLSCDVSPRPLDPDPEAVRKTSKVWGTRQSISRVNDNHRLESADAGHASAHFAGGRAVEQPPARPGGPDRPDGGPSRPKLSSG